MKITKSLILVSLLILSFGLTILSCSEDDEDEQITPTPLAVDLGPDKVVNEGEMTTLNAGIENAQYEWSTGQTTQTIEVDSTGTYWVNVTKDGNTGTDTVNVEMAYKLSFVETDYGNFLIWLYFETPLHRANFIELTESSFYDGLIFHRVVYDFVVQGGDPEGTGYGGPGYTLPAEIVSELTHVYGAVGAARRPNNINPDKESNGSQYYIVVDQGGEHGLDGEYSVFGLVISGMDAVLDISGVPVDANNKPLEDVSMTDVRIEYYTAGELQDQFGFDVN